MAKNLTQFVKSAIPNTINTEDLLSYCTWQMEARHHGFCEIDCNCLVHKAYFCVPAGICCIKIELWGAGGHNVGSNTCSFSPPSGTGAYAYKYLTTTPGTCYWTNVAWTWCCHQNAGGSNVLRHSPCRNTNRDTYVTGSGLTNFCAEHGWNNGHVCCNTVTWGNRYYGAQDSAQLNKGAQYYGADGGRRGHAGFTELIDSSVDNTDFRQYRAGEPFPGGIINKYGGWTIWSNPYACDTNSCICGSLYQIGNARTYYGAGENKGYGRQAGHGVMGGMTCGGGLTCGDQMNGGKVRITYSCCNCFDI
jgi:hypothetical protein